MRLTFRWDMSHHMTVRHVVIELYSSDKKFKRCSVIVIEYLTSFTVKSPLFIICDMTVLRLNSEIRSRM